MTVWNALTVSQYDDLDVKTKLAESTSSPLKLDDLKSAIAGAPTVSVPGPTGLTHAMMKTFDAMTMIWETGQIPKWRKRRWLCPKANTDPTTATLEDLRPICLIETKRKFWLGILVGRIILVWESEQVLVGGQCGFRQGRSCEGPVVNALEETRKLVWKAMDRPGTS